jgi:hypothetical protein
VLSRLLNLLALLSLLLCAAVIFLWVRSYTRSDLFWLTYREGGIDYFQANRGHFAIRRRSFPWRNSDTHLFHRTRPPTHTFRPPGPMPPSHEWRWGPFLYAVQPKRPLTGVRRRRQRVMKCR